MNMRNEAFPVLLADAFVTVYGRRWLFDSSYQPRILLCGGGEVPFACARSVKRTPLKTGLGAGESVRYADFEGYPSLLFETRILIDSTTGFVDCTSIWPD